MDEQYLGDYTEISEGTIGTITGETVMHEMCDELLMLGIGEIMAVPESPDDLDKDMTRSVLFINFSTADGKKHQFMFQEDAIREIFNITNKYREMVVNKNLGIDMNDPQAVLHALLEQLRKDGEEGDG